MTHARNVIDFLWMQPVHGDEVVAGDFFDTSWTPDSDPGEFLRTTIRNRAHRRVAHLTYDRALATELEREWDVREIVEPIGRCLRKFFAEATHRPSELWALQDSDRSI